MCLAFAGFVTGIILQNLAVIVLFLFLIIPSLLIFNTRCHDCHWLAYMRFGTAPDWAQKDQMARQEYSKGVWRLPPVCSKCGTEFYSASPNNLERDLPKLTDTSNNLIGGLNQ